MNFSSIIYAKTSTMMILIKQKLIQILSLVTFTIIKILNKQICHIRFMCIQLTCFICSRCMTVKNNLFEETSKE